MVDRKTSPDSVESRIPFHTAKNTLINALLKTDPETVNRTLFQLGELFSKNSDLSNTQKSKLIDGLQEQQVLTYRQDFLSQKVNENDPDMGLWNIEMHGETQVCAITATYELLSRDRKLSTIIQILSTVLNAGHKCGSDNFIETTSPGNSPSRERFLKRENEVHERRLEYTKALFDLGLLKKDQLYLVEETERDGFKEIPGYDEMLVLDTALSLLEEESFAVVYDQVQGVLYLGYGMSMRDGPIIEQRENDLYEQEFSYLNKVNPTKI